LLENPDLWHPRKGFHVVAQAIAPIIRQVYEAITRRYEQGKLVVVAGSLAFGARIAQEKLGVPLVTVHLQPSVLRTVHAMPALPGIPMPSWAPRFWKRFIWWYADRLMDREIAPPINALRAELSLPPVRRVMNG
jgi:hypothetical protein